MSASKYEVGEGSIVYISASVHFVFVNIIFYSSLLPFCIHHYCFVYIILYSSLLFWLHHFVFFVILYSSLLLDTIYDKSLEDQVVARAYRMGAIGSVIVEQLTAEDSIEEVMNTMNAKSAGNGRLDLAEFCENEKEKHAKMHTLLKSTTLIRPDTSRKNKRKPLATDGWHQHAQQKQHGNEDDNMKRPRKIGSVRFKD